MHIRVEMEILPKRNAVSMAEVRRIIRMLLERAFTIINMKVEIVDR